MLVPEVCPFDGTPIQLMVADYPPEFKGIQAQFFCKRGHAFDDKDGKYVEGTGEKK